MLGFLMRAMFGFAFIGFLTFLGWQLYVYQTVDPTMKTADSCTELFCQPGTQCSVVKKNDEDFSKDVEAPTYKCQSFVGGLFQGSFLTKSAHSNNGKKDMTEIGE